MSLEIRSLSTGKILDSHNQDKKLIPASSLKLVATSTVLELFDADHTFETQLFYTGSIQNNVLHGDVIIVGGGDPTLGSPYFYDNPESFLEFWAEEVQKLGISEINGSIIGDGSYFSLPSVVASTDIADIGNYYGSGANALSIYDNTYEVHFSSGPNDGDTTRIEKLDPMVPYLEIWNEVKSSNINRDRAYIHSEPDSHFHHIKGTIPKARKDFVIKGSIPSPELFCAIEFKRILSENGIEVKGDSRHMNSENMNLFQRSRSKEKTLISTWKSPTVLEIVTRTNYKSVNPYANTLLFHCGLRLGSIGSYDSAIDSVVNFWSKKGIESSGIQIVDGSGLSSENKISSGALVDILCTLDEDKRELLLMGLKTFGGSERIKAKSGYINGIRSYSGYLENSRGTYAFSVIVNGYTCSASAMKKMLEVLMKSYLD